MARMIMIQGTTSHAGKSVLAAALCRIFARRGLRVAPFKSQNMALNSFVTPEGGEIGRAQAYQARACGIEPHVDMNPVLLKPSSETGSQVIVLGKPVGHMSVREYHRYQPEVWPVAAAALDRLLAANDVVVAEGAGSPAEINLRHRDIANMRVALHAQCPVLIVGDIDRGGVFASLVGTMELLAPEERDLVKGFVINKFRGDASLLDSGIEFLRSRTGVETLGVVPFLKGWKGEEEDSLGLPDNSAGGPKDLTIGVIRLPFLSNYTDFDALAREPDVAVRYVTSPRELDGCDACIVPGTKSTLADLAWVRSTGLAERILEEAACGLDIVGICGGYQMLGESIRDPLGVEAGRGSAEEGLGLLRVDTEFSAEKRTVRVEGLAAGALGVSGAVRGYEIHMGLSARSEGVAHAFQVRDGQGVEHLDGAVNGRVFGTYLHGVFDVREFRRAWLDRIRVDKGLEPLAGWGGSEADDLDVLADHFERHLNLDRLAAILGL